MNYCSIEWFSHWGFVFIQKKSCCLVDDGISMLLFLSEKPKAVYKRIQIILNKTINAKKQQSIKMFKMLFLLLRKKVHFKKQSERQSKCYRHYLPNAWMNRISSAAMWNLAIFSLMKEFHNWSAATGKKIYFSTCFFSASSQEWFVYLFE